MRVSGKNYIHINFRKCLDGSPKYNNNKNAESAFGLCVFATDLLPKIIKLKLMGRLYCLRNKRKTDTLLRHRFLWQDC